MITHGGRPGSGSKGASWPTPEEITIAGNLKEMFAGIEMIGNDLVFRGRIASPTIKIGEMTIAGS